MYQEEDYSMIKKHVTRLQLCLWIPFGLIFIGILLLFLILRIPNTLTTILTIILFGAAIFVFDYYIMPQIKYQKHIDHALHGRKRNLNGYFVSMESIADKKEGVYFYPMMVYTDPDEQEDSLRLLYYDANLLRPAWEKDQKLDLTIYDKYVCDWKAAE